jgi:hypothetical protein
MQKILWVAEELLASSERLCSVCLYKRKHATRLATELVWSVRGCTVTAADERTFNVLIKQTERTLVAITVRMRYSASSQMPYDACTPHQGCETWVGTASVLWRRLVRSCQGSTRNMRNNCYITLKTNISLCFTYINSVRTHREHRQLSLERKSRLVLYS